MGFLPDISHPAEGDFSGVYKKIESEAIKRNYKLDDPRVIGVKKLVLILNNFHKGFIALMDGDTDEGNTLLDEAIDKLAELDPKNNPEDKALLGAIFSGLAAQISPENLQKGKGFSFL